ncbi:ROK family transcriptional regulator [Clostridium sp. AF19-22AC]|jgi:predicted NBD/HSP70 family sugar kinase|uniref:Putative NBD/HSP70 family sugar kinase n=1 Tax=Faecalicatena orotica TaxID=1544 RepID=A0A2Y9BD07_9FIRM|nr:MULTISPECIES: ROK family transcriptional regulator [Clostridia]PWJ30337.1 putative NBD/HSP70 family sugar kinase [Faecalicatena orotica]RHR21449.1 ROK family transcriptional regulator [Clostridium sp. AF19-22AC]SSA55328.1 Sugar kinase of the NBD/HSP70 family, may contain an N-terminal HTH domain [Faecalicatena orotica]
MDENNVNSRSLGDIYRMIYQYKECSRQEIANQLGISLPTVTQNLNKLRSLGYIYNAGNFQSTGGRKPTILRCVPDARCAMGIDITRNHLSIVLIDLDLNIIAGKRIRVPYEETTEYFNTISRETEEMIRNNVPDRSRLLGAGLSMPVIIGSDQKSVTYATVINASPNIYEKLASYIDVPILMFNDSNSAGLAESWRAHYTQPMVYLSLSSSVGGANMNNQNIYTGDNWRGCEFGHMTIVPHGKRCYCGRYGCLDAYCSSNVLSDFTGGDLKRFFTELETNKGLQNVFNQYMDHLAIAVNNLRMCYDCNIVLGGYVGAYMAEYIDTFRKKAVDLNPFEQDGSFIRVCHYRTEASAVGAAIHYINQFIQDF